MVLSDIMRRFIDQRPVAVMVRMILEKQFSNDFFDTTFEEVAQEQYTRELTFSTCAKLLAQVSLGQATTVHAAFVKERETIPVSIASLYEKLQHVEPRVCEALVHRSTAELSDVIMRLSQRSEPVAGYHLRIIDGNVLAGSEHRLKALRHTSSAAMPGKSLVLYDYATGLISGLVACEDGEASERRLVPDMLSQIKAGDLIMADSNFCTAVLLQDLQQRHVGFLIRHHAALSLTYLDKARLRGRCQTGKVYEQKVRLKCGLVCRAIIIVRDKPLKKGGRKVILLTNVPSRKASAGKLADLYLQRWTIEEAFRQLTQYLACEVRTLGYPKAALLGFTLAVLAYNALQCVQAALTAAHPESRGRWSAYYLAWEVKRSFDGLLVAVPEKEWQLFGHMSNAALADFLLRIAKRAKLAHYIKHPRGPKKSVPRKKVRSYHASTAKLLQKQKLKRARLKAH
jgi:IS4 transposase